ncbi:MAG: DNA repair protein RadC [Candidatus Melainabacteria bacterium]|nr:DNA repair protein RadC [Candidatus Melainabacteria bacterium]
MAHNLKTLPEEERPRERMLRAGPEALSLTELLAIVLGNGTQGKSVLDLSQELLERFGGLDQLIDASIVELMEVKGIGNAKAIQLLAVFEIARKCKKANSSKKFPILSAKEAYALAQAEIAHCAQEVLLVILRDVRGNLLHLEQISKGTLSQVLVHPREVFYPAVRYKAYSLILAHNHPSGDPTPSKADLDLTRALMQSSKVMGIGFDDHLIVCRDKFTSLKEMGYLSGSSMRY